MRAHMSLLAMSHRTRRVAVLAVLSLLATTLWLSLSGADNTRTATAYFPEAVGIYTGDNVTILGINVGKITKITPEQNQVAVEFTYNRSVPADVHAVLSAPSLVPVRTLALTPVYAGGAQLADHATIPLSRTAIPIEWDQIKTELTQLSTALGPDGANKNGGLNALLATTANNLRGNGAPLRQATQALSVAMQTLADNNGAVFGTVRNLDVFIRALAGSSTILKDFNTVFAQASSDLDISTRQLGPALKSAAQAISVLKPFLAKNSSAIMQAVKDVNPLITTLAQQRNTLATLLQTTPTALSNAYGIYEPLDGSIDAEFIGTNFQSPAEVLCAIFTSVGSQSCSKLLAPLLELASLPDVPGGINIIDRNGRTNVVKPPTPGSQQRGLLIPRGIS